MKKKLSAIFNTILDRPVYFFILLVLVFAISRLATWFYPINSDHFIFYYVGKIFAQGGTLYVAAWDHKPPMIFVFNAFLYFLFGGSLVWHRIFLTVLTILDIYLFYKLAQIVIGKLGFDKNNHLLKIVLILYVFFRNLSQFTSSGNNTENFGLIFLLLMYLSFFWFLQKYNRWFLVLLGACLSVLFFLKGTFALLALPIAVELVLSKRGFKNIVLDFLAIALPFLLHILVWVWYFWAHNAVGDFIIATFTFSSKYLKSTWAGHVSPQGIFILILLPLLVPLFIFIIRFLKDIRLIKKSQIYRFLFFALLADLIIAAMMGAFYAYYFLIFFPIFMLIIIYYREIFAKTVEEKSNEILRSAQNDKNKKSLMLGILILGMILSLGISYKQFYNQFWGSSHLEQEEFIQIVNYVKDHSNKNDKITVYTYGATLYWLADRDAGSRFVSASVLLLDERENYGFNLSDTYISDLEKSRPKYAVLPRDPDDLYYQNRKITDYLQSNFVSQKTFDNFIVARNKNI